MRTPAFAAAAIVAGVLAALGSQASSPLVVVVDIERAIDDGRFREAHARLGDMLASPVSPPSEFVRLLARLRVRYAIELGQWADLADLSPRWMVHGDDAFAWYARGLGAARAAWPGAAPAMMTRARDAADALAALAPRGGPSRVEVWRVSVLAAMAAAEEEHDALALLLAHASDVDRWVAASEPDPIEGVGALDALAGDLWWQVGRYAAAAEAYRRSIDGGRRPARRLLGLARSLDALGERDGATEAARAFLERWSQADADRPELVEARRLAGPM